MGILAVNGDLYWVAFWVYVAIFVTHRLGPWARAAWYMICAGIVGGDIMRTRRNLGSSRWRSLLRRAALDSLKKVARSQETHGLIFA